MRKNAVEGVVRYFHSATWKRVMRTLQEPHVRHAHVFVETSINPWSLENVFKRYFEKQGWEHYRKRNDHVALPPLACFTINPKGLPHFSVYYGYNPSVILLPRTGFEGSDFEFWTEEDTKRYIEKYEAVGFRSVGPKEVAEIRRYLRESKQWERIFTMMTDPNIGHFHVNVETSIHPMELEKFARAALEERGLKIERVVHTLFHNPPKAKMVFMMSHPEDSITWDVAWIFNLLTILKPSCSPVLGADPEFDVFTLDEYKEQIEKEEYVQLGEGEIGKIIDGIEFLG